MAERSRAVFKRYTIKVHVAVDSGMGRIGVVNEEELAAVEDVLQSGPI